MPQIVSKTIVKLMTSPLVPCNYVILCFQGQNPTFDQPFIFRGIKLKFGGGVNSETLISCFMSILSNKMNLIKIMGFISFLTNFTRPLFNKRVAMVTW